jgi:pyrimidine deaminase RibD-like protein
MFSRPAFAVNPRASGQVPHAEEAALAKLTGAQAAHTTVYTTLEPCMSRKRMPCAQRLIDRQVERVVISTLDPNSDSCGQGEWLIESAGRSIGTFESDLVRSVKAQNNEFIDCLLSFGVLLSGSPRAECIACIPTRATMSCSLNEAISSTTLRLRLFGAEIRKSELGSARGSRYGPTSAFGFEATSTSLLKPKNSSGKRDGSEQRC